MLETKRECKDFYIDHTLKMRHKNIRHDGRSTEGARDTSSHRSQNSPRKTQDRTRRAQMRYTTVNARRPAIDARTASPHMSHASHSRSHHEHSTTTYDGNLHWLHAPTCSLQGSAASRLATTIVAAPKTLCHHRARSRIEHTTRRSRAQAHGLTPNALPPSTSHFAHACARPPSRP
jgi:hypothetical protein